jgi:geranylgeranylglycerol-phosphate geranylgeranyltransferase
MRIAGFFTITRPVNSLVAGFAAIIAYLIATGTLIPQTLLLFCVVALVTAAGNVINDFFDTEIDAVNRSDRPIPSGAVTRTAARGFAVTLFLGGILVSFFTGFLCVAIAIINSAVLVAYAGKLKRTLLIGNIAVAYLSASIFLFGGALNGWDGLLHIVPLAVITFFAMLSRELVKDGEDVHGDKAGDADTVPIRFGIKKTAYLAFFCTVIAILTSFMPYMWWGTWYLAGILIVDTVLLIAVFRGLGCDTPECMKASGASLLLKAGMFTSLVVFTLSAVFL